MVLQPSPLRRHFSLVVLGRTLEEAIRFADDVCLRGCFERLPNNDIKLQPCARLTQPYSTYLPSTCLRLPHVHQFRTGVGRYISPKADGT